MSIIDPDGNKVVLPRVGPDDFWANVIDEFPESDPRRWRYLAMLALRENAGWPLERIGTALGHTKGHVGRCITKIKGELRERLGDWGDTTEPTNDGSVGTTNPTNPSGRD